MLLALYHLTRPKTSSERFDNIGLTAIHSTVQNTISMIEWYTLTVTISLAHQEMYNFCSGQMVIDGGVGSPAQRM